MGAMERRAPGRRNTGGRFRPSCRRLLASRGLTTIAGLSFATTVMALLPAPPVAGATTAPTTTAPKSPAPTTSIPNWFPPLKAPTMPPDAPTSSPYSVTTTTLPRPDQPPALPANAPHVAAKPDSFTPFSRLTTNPDGSMTYRVSARPAYYQDAAGAWHDIDTTLVTKPDGSLGAKAAGAGYARLAAKVGWVAAIVPTTAGTIGLREVPRVASPMSE